MRATLTRLTLTALMLCTACDASDGISGATSGAAGREPAQHRPQANTCDDTRSDRLPNPPDPHPSVPVDCTTHDECVAGANGRCVGNALYGWRCTYDECFEDADCGGFVCACGGGIWSDNNVCLRRGDCLTDADCGTSGFCSPSFGDSGDCAGIVGYYCHTSNDECVDDADCQGDGREHGSGFCAYDPGAAKWSCSYVQCVN